MEETLQEPEQISWHLRKQGPYHFRTGEKKKKSQNQGGDRAGTRDWMKSPLMLDLTLISKHSGRNLDTIQAPAHTSTIKASPGTEGKDSIICTPDFFFLYIEWGLDVV